MDEVKMFKLISGEEVIAKYNGPNTDGNHPIERPLAVIAQPNHQTGQVAVGFAPWIIGNNEIAETVLRDSILALDPYKAALELENGYRQAVSPIDQSAAVSPLVGI